MSICLFREASRGYRERRKGAARTSRFITLNYTKSLFWIIVNQSAVIALIYIHIYRRIIIYYRAIPLYNAIQCYYDIILCFILVFPLMRLYAIIRTYRAIILCDTVILCADTFKRLFAAVRKGKCDLLCNTEKVNIIYSQKYSKLFYINT